MTTEYTKDDDMQTLRLWYDAKPFTKELETEIRAIPTTAFSDDTLEDYIQERLKKNNGEYDKPIQKEEPKVDDTKADETKVEDAKESVQEEEVVMQEVDAVADADYWNP